jgi:nicotinate-nucleotide pyrophosphorylase (carboxylating)
VDGAPPPLTLPLSSGVRAELLRRFLAEDIGAGDVTTEAIVDASAHAAAEFEVKSPLVLAGIGLAVETLRLLDPNLRVLEARTEGEYLVPGDIAATIHGNARALLTGERVALNLLQRLCGIATVTRQLVDAVAGTRAKILDSRKTTPGLRAFERYAVRIGGGQNHRWGLDDAILIKDNHVRMAGGVAAAIRAAKRARDEARGQTRSKTRSEGRDGIRWLEAEVTTMDELHEAVAEIPDVIMLDNFTPERAREAVEYVRGVENKRGAITTARIIIETSGGITLATVRSFAEAGADWISVGALTHSVIAADISMEIRAL